MTDAVKDQAQIPEQATAATAPAEAAPATPASVDLAADEKRSGNKDAATNTDALDAAAGKESPAEADAQPSFFIQPTDRHRVEIDVLYDKKTGKLTSFSRAGIGIDFAQFKYFGHTVEWFEFSVPNYEDITNYRQRCSVYRRDAGKMLVDGVQLRNFLLVWHLKDWSLRGSDGKKIELTFTDEGAMSDDVIKQVYKLPASLLDVLLTAFEKEITLA